MSNKFINELNKSCEILGDDCKNIIEKFEKGNADDIQTINDYFNLLEKEPNADKKATVLAQLDKFVVGELKDD